jgi:hypothetical protein
MHPYVVPTPLLLQSHFPALLTPESRISREVVYTMSCCCPTISGGHGMFVSRRGNCRPMYCIRRGDRRDLHHINNAIEVYRQFSCMYVGTQGIHSYDLDPHHIIAETTRSPHWNQERNPKNSIHCGVERVEPCRTPSETGPGRCAIEYVGKPCTCIPASVSFPKAR